MTQHSGQPTTGGPQRGRHRSVASRNRLSIIVLAAVIGVVTAASLLVLVNRNNSDGSNAAPTIQVAGTSGSSLVTQSPSQTTADTCSLPGGSLTIAAAPAVADVVASLIEPDSQSGVADGCTITVTPTDPADIVANGPSGADIWIPDSSMWTERAAAAGVSAPAQSPSIATSPVILALSPAAAGQLAVAGGTPDVARILSTRSTETPVRVGLPDPEQSAAAVAVILAARAAVTGTADARAALTWAVRSGPAGLPIHEDELLDRLAADPNTAVPVSERALVTHNSTAGSSPAVALYLAPAGTALDYPVVTLDADPELVAAADDLVRLLLGQHGRDALLAAGFRAPDGTPGAGVTADNGVNPALRVTSPLPAGQAVNDAIRSVQVTNEPSRTLAVVDISGSMLGAVPGGGGVTRMDVAKEAAARGLGLYGPDSDIGLWVFSTALTPTSDHRELIPVSSLGPDAQGGGSGAQRLAETLAGIEAIPDGGTGLYDTVLDAVRAMRGSWDPARVNTVLILTDGMNDDDNGISLEALLGTLAAEQDPNRPVPVISIAFGPDSDAQALGQISRATGGAAYESRDPRQIGEIFLDAVGQRLCRPSC